MEVYDVYDGQIIPMSSGKWIHGKFIYPSKPAIQPMHPNEFLLNEVKTWARNKNPYFNLNI
jgi:hypothetical protein